MEKLYTCECGYQTTNKQSYCAHRGHCKIAHPELVNSKKLCICSGWNKGLTKDTDYRVRRNGINVSLSKKGKPGHPIDKKTRDKISKSMILAHREGRAHNINECRVKCEPSYPEKFFINCIINEFDDKNYVREFPIGRYSIDFAWVDKKLAIEIDGEQHERECQKNSDIQKDNLLHQNGWKVLRIKWKDMFNNPKKWIDISNKFIGT